MRWLKDWWLNRQGIFSLNVRIYSNFISLDFTILGYGLHDLYITYPNVLWFLPKLLDISWFKYGMFKDSTKGWELDVYSDNRYGVRFGVTIDQHCDHAGFNAQIGLLNTVIDFSICDERHWNYKAKQWEQE